MRFSVLFGSASGKGGTQTGANPADRGKSGTKRHVVVDRQGIPLAITLSAANVHDSRMMLETVDAIEPIKGRRGRPRKRPAKLHADKAYDSQLLRQELRQRGITPRIARRGIESRARLNAIGGSLSARFRGSIAIAVCASATSDAQICTWPFCRSAAR